MSAKFPRGEGAGPFLAYSLYVTYLKKTKKKSFLKLMVSTETIWQKWSLQL